MKGYELSRAHLSSVAALLRTIVASVLTVAVYSIVTSNPAQAWSNDQWPYRKPIKLDTTPAGASIATSVPHSPILVRLHSGNFADFLTMKEDASDLRFFAADEQPLKYQIEKFDPINEMALIWVAIPNVNGNAINDSAWMYYGNPTAPAGAETVGIYDVNQVAVFHFDSPAGTLPQDRTAYGNHARSFNGQITPASLIGPGASFDGKQSLAIAAKPALRMTPSTGWTFSTWIKLSTNQTDAVLLHMEEQKNSLQIGIDAAGVYARATTGAAKQETPRTPLAVATWQHVAVVVGSGQLIVYVNGVQSAAVTANVSEIGGDMMVGASLTNTRFLRAELDEVQISNVARSPDWIKLAVMSQGQDAKLVRLGESEQAQGAGSTSYFGVILNNVTIDGWVVIGILVIMAVASWLIMLGKGLYIRRVRKDNRAFLEAFKELGAASPNKLDQDDDSETQALANAPLAQALFGKHDHYQSSSLYHLYHTGIQEVNQRVGATVGAQAARLTTQSLDTIRAGVDAALVREAQKLNSQMVLLTIAISGGPFLGLLGTVVGVMITFAAIAASGDVNINAIAPGIAAALVATVAGLAVAIPALFGYNYLASRIKEIVADMQVFVDELMGRIAEHYV